MLVDILYNWIILVTVHTSNHFCNSPYQCDLETIQCTDNEPCLIECSDNYSCKYSTIICPKNDICNVQCIGNGKRNQCEHINITATHSTILILNVSSIDDTSPRTMRNAYIYCPYNTHNNTTNPSPNCLMNCNGEDLMKKTIIYAINGLNDIELTSTDLCYRNGQIQCNQNYTETCLISNEKPFQCLDELSQCRLITNNPTSEPTLYPITNTTISIDLTTSTFNNEYSTTIELKISNPFISWHNNTFMTIIVIAVTVSFLIILAICIVCYKRIIQIKNEQNDVAVFPQEPGVNRHDAFHDNERAQLHENKPIVMHRTESKERVGEYDIVLSSPIDSDYE